jgi:hypothetical protein
VDEQAHGETSDEALEAHQEGAPGDGDGMGDAGKEKGEGFVGQGIDI